jgi:hypothetical protein
VLCLSTNIRLSIAILRASASYLTDNISSILVPIVSFIIALGVLAAWITAAIYLFSVGTITPVTGGTQYRTIEW